MDQKENEFTDLVKQYKSTIYTVCAMFADCDEDTNDLVQEALINMWRGFADLQEVTKAWVWRVTMNSCITIDRKRKKHKSECPLTTVHENVLSEQGRKANPQVKMLYDRIHSLNPFDRAIVLLWLEGMSYEEIGQIIGITTKNVSVKLFRIKEQLKNQNNNGK